MINFPFFNIPGSIVYKILNNNLITCIDVVKQAYILHAEGGTVAPKSQFLRLDKENNNRIISLPAYIDKPFNVAGVKWIASYPGNIKHSIPRASALMLLNDIETGYPYACIEASIISAIRTAASAVLFLDTVSISKKVSSIAIIGCGTIAKYIYKILKADQWEVDRLNLYDIHQKSSLKFNKILPQKQNITVCRSVEQAVIESNIIITTTVSTEPYLNKESLFIHNPIILHISLRDIGAGIIETADNFTDDVEHATREGTSLEIAYQKYQHKDFIKGTLYDLIVKNTHFNHEKLTVFSPFGLGVLDVALGKHVYDIAKK